VTEARVPSLVERLRAGDVREAARLMRDLDDELPGAEAVLRELFVYTGRAFVLGITGAPGVGKSSVVDGLVGCYRARGERVGVVAVDPTSPFSGGAILGDRIRMQQHALDPGVFIRSLATRGQLGGLSRATSDVVNVLDAMGFGVIITETVGVGQDEVEIARLADTTVVITAPGLGDDVQAIKAGLLEIADVLVVNKADREGADRAVRDLETMLELRQGGRGDREIVETVATRGTGMSELVASIDRHRAREQASGGARERRRRQAESQIRAVMADRLRRRAEAALAGAGGLAALADAVAERRRDPYSAADAVLEDLGFSGGPPMTR
jgi:LAO/AO transport system kinase